MSVRPAPFVALGVLVLAFAAETAYYLPLMPQRLATHFDAIGRANGWSGTAEFVSLTAWLLGGAAFVFAMAGLLDRLPDDFINLPNKTYWLRPERRAPSMAFLIDQVRWIVLATVALVVLVAGLVYRTGLADPPRLSGAIYGLLGGYAVAVLALTVAMLWRFRRPPRA